MVKNLENSAKRNKADKDKKKADQEVANAKKELGEFKGKKAAKKDLEDKVDGLEKKAAAAGDANEEAKESAFDEEN